MGLDRATAGERHGMVKWELTGGQDMEPLEIHVRVSPDDEVLALRARAEALERALEEMKAQRDRAEYKYRCEVVVSGELLDLCRAHGVKYRPSLEKRPW